MLKQLRELLGTDPDCLKFLNGSSGMNVLTDVIGSHLDVFPTMGHADLFLDGDPSALGAISGAGELQAGFSILVNNSGPFFTHTAPNGAPLSAAGFEGGTPAARGQILLHEFGHITKALDPDRGKPKVGRKNDEKVKENCKKTLEALKKQK